MDFTRDPEAFSGYLNTVKYDWTSASSEFMGLLEHWQLIAAEYYSGLVEIEAAEAANSMKGKVLGKCFLLELNPLAKDQVGYAEVILSTSKSVGSNVELDRFLVRRDGAVIGTDGYVLADPHSDMHSFRIFTSVLRAVVDAPSAVND